jgi:chemotaxis protein MotB
MTQADELTQLRQEATQLRQTLATTRQQAETAQAETQRWQEQHAAVTQTLAQVQDDLQRVTAEAATTQQKLEDQKAQRAQKMTRIRTLSEHFADGLQELVRQHQVTLQQGSRHLTIRVGGETLFRPGRVSLRTESRKVLDKIATTLQAFPDYHIQVEGHTDNVPMGRKTRDYWPTNWELSTARATAVVRYLQEHGIAPEQLTASGYAFYHPVAPNDTPVGRAQNRRIEITVLLPEAK